MKRGAGGVQAVFDRIFWHALSGHQAGFALGGASARRMAPGLPPMLAFADDASPDFQPLLPLCAAGESFFCENSTAPLPSGWREDLASTMVKMVWDAPSPVPVGQAAFALLGPSHIEPMLALAALTRPGPFGPRTPELGQYLGVFEDGQLVAMAGERLQAGTLREISGVCTEPAFQGRGLARALVAELVRRQLARGQTPVLHVMSANTGARDLYRRMGFREYREAVVRVVTRTDD